MSGEPAGRIHAFDHLKAWAIVAVVFTHAGPDSFRATGEPWLWFVTKVWTVFHVPSFLFVSGYLYASPRAIGLRRIGQRLVRVLLPYGLACAVGLALVVPPESARDALERIAFGNVVGIYYYIFLFVTCLLLMGPLSWLGRGGALALWCGYVVYSAAVLLEPGLRTSEGLFWLVRDPLQLFNFGYFLSGWVAALWAPELAAAARRLPWLLPSVALGLAVPGLLLEARVLDFELTGLNRVPYSLGVIALFCWLADRPAGRVTRFLGDATLAIYLHHFWWMLAVRPALQEWPLGLALAAQVGAGLIGGVVTVLAARRLLGPDRARRWVGA